MEVEDMFSCPVCLERMEQPKMLQCQHTFCSECLKKMVKDTRICCPECRAIHKLDHRGVEGLPNNLTMMKFLHGPTQKKYNVEALCQDCKKKNIQAECCHCDKILCDGCLVKHTRILSDELRRSVSEAEALLPAMNSQIPENENESERVKKNAKTVRSEIQRWRKNCSEKLESTTKKILGEVEDFEKKGTGLFKELKEKHASIQSLSKIAAMKTEKASQMQGADGPIRQMQNEIIGLTKQCKSHASSAANLVRDIKARPKQSLKFCSDESQSIVDSLSGFGGLDVSVQVATPAPTTTRNAVSTIIDKDIYAYIEKVHKNDLDAIKRRFAVNFVCKNLGDAARIEVWSLLSSSSDAESAEKALQDLQQSVQNSAGQDIVETDSKLPPNTVENIFAELLPDLRDVHMARVHASPNQVIIVAPNAEKCRMAVDMLKHYLRMTQPTPRQPNAGYQNGSNSPNVRGQENKIAVDKDMFQFLQLVEASALDRIWDTNGAKILVSTVGDCSNIEVVSKGSSRPFRPSTAIDQFQKIYSNVNDTACQEMYDLGKLRGKPTDQKVEEAIRLTRGTFTDIYVTRMFEDKDQVLFIAEKNDRCEQVMKMFASIVGAGQ